jgi:hypothetical protein
MAGLDSFPSLRSWPTIGSLVCAMFGASTLPAQMRDSVARPHIRIIGVYDVRTGDPLPGVVVRDAFSGSSVVTSATGTARLDFLTYRGEAAVVSLQKLGFEAKQLLVARSDTTPITELLAPATMLAPVVTNETYRIDRDAGLWEGLAQRCQSKAVTCFDDVTLEKHPLTNVARLLLRASGVTIGGCGGGRGKWLANRDELCGSIAMHSTSIPPSYCYPTFFVDGFRWNSSMGSPIDSIPTGTPDARFGARQIKAIEVYSSEKPRPLRFLGNPFCGAIVIWTK